mmetsp:Transcript_13844/g.21521  ORF Transcript_13844/g.21521 Transcript_13844/m.21521 type:complete len:92 (-) Transcript_13844:117-392(-)
MVSVRLPNIKPPPPANLQVSEQILNQLEVSKGILEMVERALQSDDPHSFFGEQMGELERLVDGRKGELSKQIEEGNQRIENYEKELAKAGV